MSNVINFNTQDERYDEAGLWIARMDRGLSADEKQRLHEWLADAGNRDALFGLASLWDNMDSLSQLADICPGPEQRYQHRSLPRLAIAASVILALLAGIWSLAEFRVIPDSNDANHSNSANLLSTRATYETSVGEQSSIMLSDGTRITLNTNSLLAVDYSNEHRLLRLQRGELHVRTAHDPSRPLSVLANDRVVQAVGTEFSVEITSDRQVELIVTDGRVLVGILDENSTLGTGDVPSLLVELPLATVSAGQEIMLGGTEEEVRTLTPEDIEVRLSWRDGNLIFRGESLEEAVNEIGRYSMVEFVFLDESAKRVRVAGRFKAGDLDELLSALRENFDIAYERAGDDTILLSAR